MKITKALAAILALMLVLALGMTLVSCGGDTCTEHADADGNGKCDTCGADVEPENGGNEGGGSNTDVDIPLISGGAANFRVVASNDMQTTLGKTLTNFVKAINQCIEAKNVDLVLDTVEAQEVEILIGAIANRGAEYNMDPYALGYDGYAVRVIGTKIVVIAGSTGAYKDALNHLEKNVFGIADDTESIDNIVANASSGIEAPQTEFDLTVTVAGNDLKDYVFAINSSDKNAKTVIEETRAAIYKKTGAYLETVLISDLAAGQRAVYIETLPLNGDRTSANGYAAYVDENGSIHFESEFPDKFASTVIDYLNTTIIKNKKATATISKGTIDTKDLRNVYYSDFGAKGDGETDDFFAIQACHEYANKWGNTVHANEGKTYYIGNKTNGAQVTVKTDTYMHGANFIVDDHEIEIHYNKATQCNKEVNGECSECLTRGAAIFFFDNDIDDVNVKEALQQNLPIMGGFGESDNTTKFENWPLDYDALVVFGSSERKIYIRQGANADGGDDQYEAILVHADGTIDPSTPLTWDYTKVSWATAYSAEDKEIIFDGALYDDKGNIVSMSNYHQLTTRPENNKYIATSRNLYVSRSNVTIKNFEHTMTDDWEFRTPYAGFLCVYRSNNTTFENIILQTHDRKYEAGTLSGTYEIGGTAANDTKYYNVRVSNFFCDGGQWDYASGTTTPSTPGAVDYRGCMGSNYCRNFYFENCTLNSFDAHKGLGNLTIRNSTFEHINIFGMGGVAAIYDSTVYVDGGYAIFNFREDYGATWRGDVIIENVTMKYSKDYQATNKSNELYVINSKRFIATDYDQDLVDGVYVSGKGTTNYLPVNVSIKGLKLVRYTYEYVSPSYIIETAVPLTTTYIYMYYKDLYSYQDDISKFADDGGYTNLNRLIGTEYVYIEDSNVDILFPQTPQFDKTIIEYGPLPSKED